MNYTSFHIGLWDMPKELVAITTKITDIRNAENLGEEAEKIVDHLLYGTVGYPHNPYLGMKWYRSAITYLRHP